MPSPFDLTGMDMMLPMNSGAEAVETAAQADILRAMGCDIVQGYVFAQPMFEEEFLSWIGNADRGAKSVA